MKSDKKYDNFLKELRNKLNQRATGNISEETVLIKAFKYFDLDNSGKCGKEEFLRTMSKIGITGFSDSEILSFFTQFDTDGSNSLDYKEFVSALYANKSLNTKKSNNVEEKEKEKEKEKEPPKVSPVPHENITNVEQLIKRIREKLSARGIEGICGLARNFRIIDDNNTQTIDIEEFRKCCRDFQFGLTDKQVMIVFNSLDRDNSGEIDYDEFLRTLRGDMNSFRKNLVQQAFNKLDTNSSGEITFDELQSKYSTKNHPEVKSGHKTENQVLQEFMNTFQDTYNYLCGTENDEKITFEEFLEYYENLSMSIDKDAYFELLISMAWGLGEYEEILNKNKTKGWSNKEEGNEENLQNKYQEKFGNKTMEKEGGENLINQFRKEVLKKGSGGIISLGRQFKIFDDNGNKHLEIEEFAKALKENSINLPKEEVIKIFKLFDKDESGTIDYEEFLRTIRGPMNKKREQIVKQAFNKLDVDKSGVVDLYDIKTLYNAKNHRDIKSGKKTEEEVYTEFMNTFIDHHNLKAGMRNKRVSLEEFLEYYNYISMSIDDDDYFIFMMQNAWKLNTNNSNNFDNKSLSDFDNAAKMRERDFNTRQAPFGTDEEPKKEEFIVDNSLKAIEKFRAVLQRRGTRGIMSAKREFMIADDDNSKSLDKKELKKFCHDYRIPISESEEDELFNAFDTDKSGSINYDEFLRQLVGEMNNRRKNLISQVFKIFDKNGNGLIELDDIRNAYNAKNHPEVKNGKKTEDEVLAEFLDNFEYQFSLLNDAKGRDGKITLEEFIEYYNNISMSVDDDDYFEEIIKSAYNLDGRKTNKKAWKGEY